MGKLHRNQRNKSKLMTDLDEILHKYGLNPTWLDKWIMQMENENSFVGGWSNAT